MIPFVVVITVSFDMNWALVLSFGLLHLYLSFYISYYLEKRKYIKSIPTDELQLLRSPIDILNKILWGLFILTYILGWIALLSGEETYIWNNSLSFAALPIFLASDVVISKTQILYRDMLIDISDIQSIETINKNKVILMLSNNKKVMIGHINIAKQIAIISNSLLNETL